MSDNEVRERLLVVDETCRCCVNNSGETNQPHRCVNMMVDNDLYFFAASAAEYAFGNYAYGALQSKAAAAPPCPWFTRRRE